MSWFAQIQIKTVFLKLDCVQRLACDRRSVHKGWRSWEDGVRRPILKAMASSEWKRAVVSIDECRWWRKVATDEREKEREKERKRERERERDQERGREKEITGEKTM